MKIEHLALWTKDIETMRRFYTQYFGATANAKYRNEAKNFESYFLSFSSGARLELMHNPSIPDSTNDFLKQSIGCIHIAFSVGSKDEVIALTERLKKNGYEVLDGPRTTGDGYFESTVFDPEKNRIEITV